nr:uncharacterized protein LOC128691225 [Cherax quadricarinatus]
MSDKSKALRIISAINDKISSRYSSSDVARRNRVVIKKEQKNKTAKVKSIKETNADEGNVDPGVASQGSAVFQEKWLMATKSFSSSDSAEEDMIPVIPKGRQLPRTPVKTSVETEEELQVLSVDKASGNSTFNVENISEVTDSEESSNHDIKNLLDQREANYIPTGKQIPRTPHLQEELHSSEDLESNSFVCHNALVLPTNNNLTENSNGSELKEEALGNETNHAVPLISREVLSLSSCSTEMSRQKYHSKEECSKIEASQYPDFQNDRLNAEVVEQIPVASSTLQNDLPEAKILKLLNETFSLSSPAVETCNFKISAEYDKMQTSNVTSEFYVGLGNSSDFSNETVKVENEFQQDRTFSVLESPTVSCVQSVSQISSEFVCYSKSLEATKKLVNYSLNESSPFELPEPKNKMIAITQRDGSTGKNDNSVISDLLKYTMSKDKGNEAAEKLSVSLNEDQSELKENVDASYLSHESSPYGACLLTPPVGFSDDDKTCSGMPKKLLSKTHGTDHHAQDECTHSYLDIPSDNTSVQPFVAQVLCDSLEHSFPKLSLGLDEYETENDESRVIHSAQSPVSPHNAANKNETFTQSETSEATLSEILQSWKDTEVNCDKNLGIFQLQSKIKKREHNMKDSQVREDSLIMDKDSTLVATANSVKEVEFNDSFDIFPIKKGKRIAKNVKETKISSLGMEGTSENATRDEEDLKCIKKRLGTLRKEGKIKSSNSLRKNTRNSQAVTQDEPASLLDETYLVKKDEVLNEKKIMENDRPVNKKDNQQILRKDKPKLIRDEVFLKDNKDEGLKITRNIHADSKENENNSRKLKSSENKTKQHNGSKRIKRSCKQDVTKSPEHTDISYHSPKFKTRPTRKTKKDSTKDILLNKDSNKYTNDNESESCERSLAKIIDLNENFKKPISARSITAKHTKNVCFTNTASTVEEEWGRIFDTKESKPKAVAGKNYLSELDVSDPDDGLNSFDEKGKNGRKEVDTHKKIHSDESMPVPVIDSNHKISSIMAPLNIGTESPDQGEESKYAEETGDKKSLSQISTVKVQNIINPAEQITMSNKDMKKRKAASKQLITTPSSILDDEVCADLQSLNLHSCETVRPQATGREYSKTQFAESSSTLSIKQKKKHVDSEQLPECSSTRPPNEIDSQFQALSLQPNDKSNTDSVLNDSSPPTNKMTKTKIIRERENKIGLCRNKSSISEKKVVQEIISTNHDPDTDEKINNKQRARRTQASTSGRNKQIKSLEKENVPHDSLNSRAGTAQDKDKKAKICRTKNVDENKKSISDESFLENSYGNSGPTRAPLSRRCKNKALTAISEIYKDSDDFS